MGARALCDITKAWFSFLHWTSNCEVWSGCCSGTAGAAGAPERSAATISVRRCESSCMNAHALQEAEPFMAQNESVNKKPAGVHRTAHPNKTERRLGRVKRRDAQTRRASFSTTKLLFRAPSLRHRRHCSLFKSVYKFTLSFNNSARQSLQMNR